MNTRSSLFIALALLFATASLVAQSASAPARVASTGGKSPHETTSTFIGSNHVGSLITLTYGRPFSKAPKTGELRKIWGALVPWDKAYRLGADEATLLITQKPLLIGETTIPAGAYTLYLIPSEHAASQLAFSTNLGKWGEPVDETHDLARVPLQKSPLDPSVDQLTLSVDKVPGSNEAGVLRIKWETTQFALPFTVAK